MNSYGTQIQILIFMVPRVQILIVMVPRVIGKYGTQNTDISIVTQSKNINRYVWYLEYRYINSFGTQSTYINSYGTQGTNISSYST